jgi:hypothetical protein
LTNLGLGEISFKSSRSDRCALSFADHNSIVAYQILHMGAKYITKALNSCIGGLVRLSALLGQIQLMYYEMTSMMRPNAFVLDLITEPIPVHVMRPSEGTKI